MILSIFSAGRYVGLVYDGQGGMIDPNVSQVSHPIYQQGVYQQGQKGNVP